MVPRRRNAMTTQTLRRRLEPVLLLRLVSVSGPITASAASSPRRKDYIFWEALESGPYGGRQEGQQGPNGSVSPFAVRRRGAIISPQPCGTGRISRVSRCFSGRVDLLFPSHPAGLFHARLCPPAEQMARAIAEETQQLETDLNEERSRYQNLLTEHLRLEEKHDDLKEEMALSSVRGRRGWPSS